jgi:hypothetical protein
MLRSGMTATSSGRGCKTLLMDLLILIVRTQHMKDYICQVTYSKDAAEMMLTGRHGRNLPERIVPFRPVLLLTNCPTHLCGIVELIVVCLLSLFTRSAFSLCGNKHWHAMTGPNSYWIDSHNLALIFPPMF